MEKPISDMFSEDQLESFSRLTQAMRDNGTRREIETIAVQDGQYPVEQLSGPTRPPEVGDLRDPHPLVHQAKIMAMIEEGGAGTSFEGPVRVTKDDLFMLMAYAAATRSTCSRMHVGCVITDAVGEQMAIGYNGGPKGGRNSCRREGAGQCGHIHAEVNASIKAHFPGVNKTAYVTISPCEPCAVTLINAGVVRVVVGNVYRDEKGLDILREVGAHITVLNPEVLEAKA